MTSNAVQACPIPQGPPKANCCVGVDINGFCIGYKICQVQQATKTQCESKLPSRGKLTLPELMQPFDLRLLRPSR